MRFKLKEDEILEFLDLNFPQQTFEKGRLLIGQNKRQPLHVYYFGKKFLIHQYCIFIKKIIFKLCLNIEKNLIKCRKYI